VEKEKFFFFFACSREVDGDSNQKLGEETGNDRATKTVIYFSRISLWAKKEKLRGKIQEVIPIMPWLLFFI
jgi:hypothetical protein